MKLPSLIGVVHLPPLAGSPGASRIHPAQALQAAGLRAVKEAQIFEKAGFEGIILENFGDAPFYKEEVPPETVASVAVVAAAVREATRLPLGVNLLRNAGRQALAVASVTGCQFIRVNVLSGVAATDQGLIEGRAAELLRERERLESDVAIFADVHVKHARSLSSDDIGLAVEETAGRGGASAVIVSGSTTGRPADPRELGIAAKAAKACGVPLYLGSGVTAENLKNWKGLVSGVIVSSALRQGGRPGANLDLRKASELARAFRAAIRTRPKRK